MEQKSYTLIIKEQTKRALWEVNNVVECVPDELWDKEYCGMPMWKHIYHMLHSLDLWYINPQDHTFKEPFFHEKDLNNLEVVSDRSLTRYELNQYIIEIDFNINEYHKNLTDSHLLEFPSDCEYTKFTLIMAQFRHLHSHMGMIMGFIISDTGLWPRVLGLENPFPSGDYNRYF